MTNDRAVDEDEDGPAVASGTRPEADDVCCRVAGLFLAGSVVSWLCLRNFDLETEEASASKGGPQESAKSISKSNPRGSMG